MNISAKKKNRELSEKNGLKFFYSTCFEFDFTKKNREAELRILFQSPFHGKFLRRSYAICYFNGRIGKITFEPCLLQIKGRKGKFNVLA